MTLRTELSTALDRLEASMRAAGIWNQPLPTPEAFASREPFAIDKMSLPQWLRYVFVARMRELLAAGKALPESCSIGPAAQAYLPEMSQGARVPLIQVLNEIDELITDGTDDGAQTIMH